MILAFAISGMIGVFGSKSPFGQAFSDARNDRVKNGKPASGGTFWHEGNLFTTNRADDKVQSSPVPSSTSNHSMNGIGSGLAGLGLGGNKSNNMFMNNHNYGFDNNSLFGGNKLGQNNDDFIGNEPTFGQKCKDFATKVADVGVDGINCFSDYKDFGQYCDMGYAPPSFGESSQGNAKSFMKSCKNLANPDKKSKYFNKKVGNELGDIWEDSKDKWNKFSLKDHFKNEFGFKQNKQPTTHHSQFDNFNNNFDNFVNKHSYTTQNLNNFKNEKKAYGVGGHRGGLHNYQRFTGKPFRNPMDSSSSSSSDD